MCQLDVTSIDASATGERKRYDGRSGNMEKGIVCAPTQTMGDPGTDTDRDGLFRRMGSSNVAGCPPGSMKSWKPMKPLLN